MLDIPTRISGWLLELVGTQRAVAHLLVDGEQKLAAAGGCLENYGLADLTPGHPATEQLPFLEGLLPLPESPFLIRSMGTPSGRVADVHLLADGDSAWVLFLDVTAEHDEAQKVQQKAYDMTLLSQREARLIAKLEAAHAELTSAHRALAESREALLLTHNRLQGELGEAERYVRATLPAPFSDPFSVDWLYVPSTELGGDSLGYHWIDPEHFALYLLDVCGHGVGAALLAVAAVNTLRSGALSDADFRRPDEVLRSLNRAYQMEHHNEMYFTIWYGVFHPSSGRLRYASAGHPPPILVNHAARASGDHGAGEERSARMLPSKGPSLGLLPDARYPALECTLNSPAQLYVFSDGVYEVTRPDGTMLEFADLEKELTTLSHSNGPGLEAILRFVQDVRGGPILEDDFSIVRLTI